MKSIVNDLLGMVFPKVCAGCGEELLKGEKEVCFGCLGRLQRTEAHKKPEENDFFYRVGGLSKISGCMAYYYFDKGGTFQRIISGLKYKNRPQIGVVLGESYGREILESGWKSRIDAIIPVPLHSKRLRERGYNQAMEISKGVSSTLGVPILGNALKRKVNTKTQTGKGQEERWQSLGNAFSYSGEVPKRVMLVDDVMTTGSTFLGCVNCLNALNNPPDEIYLLALGITRKE